MIRSAKVLAFAAVLLALLSGTGCTVINKLKARDQLNKGVQAYKNAKYEEAIERFKNAVGLDPSLVNARLYLATAYANQFIPGVETEENLRAAEQAIEQFKQVLSENPSSEAQVNSLKGIASLYLNMKKFEEAKTYYRKVTEIDPNDPEAYYSVAVIDWTQSYAPRMEERGKLGLKPDEALKDKKVCEQLKAKNAAIVEDGMKMLDKALELRADYDDAMAYYNLLWREKADLECGDAGARMDDLKKADDWVDKTMATKKAKAEKASGPGGIVMDQK